MAGQQICLKWNSFQTNIVTSFENLWEEEGLVDVTLASDGQCIRAHKVILSACSPFFRQVFQSNPCQHPVIILQDVHFSELESLLCFVYKGEVNIGQESLPALLKAAETLQIRGLSGASEQVKEKMAVPRKTHPSPCEAPSDASLHPPAKRHRGCSTPPPPPPTPTPTLVEQPPTSPPPPCTPPLALTAKTEGRDESTQVPPCGSDETGLADEVVQDGEGEGFVSHGGADSVCGGDDEDEEYGEEDRPLAHLSLKMEPPEFDYGGDSNSLPLALTLTLPNSSEEVNLPSMLSKVRRASDCRGDASQIKGISTQWMTTRKISSQVEVRPVSQSAAYPATPFPCPFCERAYTSWGFRRRHIKAVHAFSSPLQLSCKWCPKQPPGAVMVNNRPTYMSVSKWEKHVMDKHGMTIAEVHSSLEILEEAHMVLQNAEPLRLTSIGAGTRVNSSCKESKKLRERLEYQTSNDADLVHKEDFSMGSDTNG